jgi:hypothetical protein
MYKKLGLKDRLLVGLFGWVTGIRLLNPPENIFTDEEEATKKSMHASKEKESDYTNVSIADVGV